MIRPAREDDVARYAIVERAAATLYAPWGLDGVLMDAPTMTERVVRAVSAGELLVTTDAHDTLIGYALLEQFGRDVHLEELAVHPDHGRRGHGTALLEATLGFARVRGAARVTLVTLDFVPFGKTYYEPRGFRVLAPDEIDARLAELAPPGGDDGRIAMMRLV